MTQPAPTPNAVDAQGNPTVVDYSQLGEAWKQGQAQPLAGQTYYFKHPNGTIEHTADPTVMQAALERGASFFDPAAAQATVRGEELEHKSFGAAGAFVGGAAEQGTLGLSDVAGQAFGGDEFKEIRQHQREKHPYATFLGEAAGAAGLAAVTGGGSLGESAAARGLEAVGGLGEGTLARIGTRTLLGAARAGVDGAQIGMSQAVSDAAFADKPLTASQIASVVGMNALWGAATGGALGLFSSAGEEGLGKLLNRGATTSADVEAVAGRALGEEPAEGLGEHLKKTYAKVAGAASGHDPSDILSVLENRADLADADEIRNAAAKAIRASGDDITKNGDKVRDIWSRGIKRNYIASSLEGVDTAEAARVTRNMVDETLSRLQNMADDPEAFGGAEPLKRAIKIAQKASDALDDATSKVVESEAAGRPVNGHVADMYGTVDDLKKAIGKYTQGARQARGGATDELIAQQNAARVDAYKGLYDHLRTGLEDENTWGKLGTAQKEVNQIYMNQIDASQRYNRALTTELGRNPEDPWEKMTGVDPAKVDTYVKNLTNPSKDLTHQAVNDYVDHTEALTRKMLEHFDLSAEDRAAVEKVAEAAGNMRETLSDSTRKLQVVNQYQKLQEKTAGHALGFGLLAATMGHPGAALPMAAIGKVAGIFTHPAETIHKLAVVEKMVRESDSRIARAIRGFASGMGRRVEAVDVSSFGRKAAKVAEMGGNAEGLAARVGTNLSNLRTHAPGLADALTATSLAAAKYLSSKLPPRLPSDPLDPKAKPLAPSQEQKEAFLRSYKAVTDPLSVVDDLRDGRLHPDAIEALKQVHPPLYAQVQKEAMVAAAKGKFADLTPQKRAALGILLDIQLPELSPEWIAARQQAYAVGLSTGPAPAPGAEGKPQGGPGPKQGGGGGRRSKPMDMGAATPKLAVDRIESSASQE